MAGIKQITDVIYLNLSIAYYYIEISRFRRAAVLYIILKNMVEVLKVAILELFKIYNENK